MTAPSPPRAPAWVRWTLRRLLPERELRVVLDELAELHAWQAMREGARRADRRYLRQLRRYPVLLLAERMRAGVRVSVPGMRDLVQAGRSLARVPALSGAIILTVGIGIGACTAIFAVVDALYFHALPYAGSDRLYWIHTDSPPDRWPFAVVDYEALAGQQTSFERVGAYTRRTRTLATRDGAERLQMFDVTPGLFETLAITPVAGRLPVAEEGASGAAGTVVVTEGFALRHLGAVGPGASDAIGRVLRLDGEEYELIGVLASGTGPLTRGVEVFPTLRIEPPQRKGPFFLSVVGRLGPRTDPTSAAIELRAINRRLFPLWSASYQDERASWGMMELGEVLQGDVDRLLGVLMGAVALLLLIATVNAANLLLARVSGRRTELAVRVALGASRGRIGAHLLAESAILAAGGVVVGIGVARVCLHVLPAVASGYIPRVDEAGLGGHTLAFAVALSMASALFFGLIPALRAGTPSDLALTLRAGGRQAGAGRRGQRAQRILVAGQFALALPLLTGAGLLATSWLELQRLDPGFDAERLVTMRAWLSRSDYPDAEARRLFWSRAIEQLGAIPGVAAVSLATARPGEPHYGSNNFDLEERPTPPGQSQPAVPWIFTEPGFFETAGIPLLEGRLLDERDAFAADPAVLVDAAWARRFFPGESALGKRLREGGATTGPWTTVVGVVGDVPFTTPGRTSPGTVYAPDAAGVSAIPFLALDPYLFVRANGDPSRFVTLIREELRRLDASVPVTEVATGEGVLRDSLTQPRHLSLLLSSFATAALALAVIGLYGITAYRVQQRRRDIAVRLAMGGAPATILLMVLRQSLILALAGLAAGIAIAIGTSQLLGSLLFGVAPRDPRMFAAVAALSLAVATAAALIPGWRALRVDPASTLRQD